jgi:hypothetical protein
VQGLVRNLKGTELVTEMFLRSLVILALLAGCTYTPPKTAYVSNEPYYED